ncbi:hypothetical protein TRIUR3_06227 [Triticum urartu]|uniref:Uncharacterized protein n=1 Tax=Triticum urartu TaxID=4572 RepID=M7ZUA1_TRIUA|nr:hypothetical protein TRIUR3_06227 [Triticum urartu]
MAFHVLLLLDDGGRRGHAGCHLVDIHATGFFLYMHGTAKRAWTADGAVAGTEGGDARAGMEQLATPPQASFERIRRFSQFSQRFQQTAIALTIPFFLQHLTAGKLLSSVQPRQAAMDGDSPVMTDSERRAYRYVQAPKVQGLGGIKNSWSNDSLFSLSYAGAGGRAVVHSCVCAPTTHPGSFRCKHHRQSAAHLGVAGHAQAQPTAEAKRNEVHGEMSTADDEKAS